MSEYIIEWSGIGARIVELIGSVPACLIPKRLREERLREEIVRCRDCASYYEADEYHPNGNYIRCCCKYFDAYSDEVEPNGFCAWAERGVE